MKAYVVQHEAGITILAPYNASFVEELKRRVHWTMRVWQPDSKSWGVRASASRTAIDTLHEFYDSVETVYTEPPTPAYSPPPPPPPPSLTIFALAYPHAATLQVWPTASPDVIHAAYRVLSKKVHPDVGGTHEQMRDLNRAYDTMKGRR